MIQAVNLLIFSHSLQEGQTLRKRVSVLERRISKLEEKMSRPEKPPEERPHTYILKTREKEVGP